MSVHSDNELAVISDFIESLGGHPLTGKDSVVFVRLDSDPIRSGNININLNLGFPEADNVAVRVGKILYRTRDETMFSYLTAPFYWDGAFLTVQNTVRNIFYTNVIWIWKPDKTMKIAAVSYLNNLEKSWSE
jgi:hypothetical protein